MLSFDVGRDAVPVDQQADLAVALGMNRGDCNSAIRMLQEMGILNVERLGGRWWFELKGDVRQWLARPPVRETGSPARSARAGSEDERTRMMAAWALLEGDGDPQQGKLGIELPVAKCAADDGGFTAALGSVILGDIDERSRNARGTATPAGTTPGDGEKPARAEFGISKLPPGGQGGEEPEFGISKSAEFGISKLSDVRAPARAGHEHDTRATPYMLHEHGPGGGVAKRGARGAPQVLTTDEQRDLMRMIEELVTDPGEQRAFCTTWTGRIVDWPNIVFRAIGETRVAGREGRITTTPGRFLNYTFKEFREAEQHRRAAAKQQATS